MELNAPIPKYANLRFLLYRWGFHHVDEGGYTAFKDALDSYTLHDGLVVYLSKPRPWVEYDGDEDWLTEGVAYSLDELNKEGAVTHNILMFGSYKPVKLSFFYLDSKGASHLVPHSDKKQNTSFLSYENIKNKPGDQGDKQAFIKNIRLKKSAHPASIDGLVVERQNLQAFEQRVGFYGHGLDERFLETYAPVLTETEKKAQTERRESYNLEEFNTKKSLSASDLKETVKLFRECRLEHPRMQKTKLLNEVGLKLGGISGQAVKKRLDKALTQVMIEKSEINF